MKPGKFFGLQGMLLYIVLLLAGTLFIFFFWQFAIAAGKRTRSPALIAEGRHRQVDVLSSIVVLVSVILNYFEIHWTVMGITIDQMGAALISEELETKIRNQVANVEKIIIHYEPLRRLMAISGCVSQ